MRAKVLLIVLLGAVAILAPALYIRFKPAAPPPAAPVTDQPVADTAAAPAQPISHSVRRVGPDQSREGLSGPSVQPAEMDHDTYVLKTRGELSELGMQNDPESLKKILSELENPEPEIRKAALTATLDFGSKDAIPTLQNELNWATDPQEKVDIQKAIDFLELPTLSNDATAQN